MVSSTDGSAAPGSGACTSMASCTAIPHDGRDAWGWHALLESQRRTESERGPATEARSWPAAPQHHTQCSCWPATLGFVSGITSSHAFHGFSRYACRAFGNWTAQSIALDSRCSCSAEHGTHGRCRGHARNAPELARFVTPRQRCVPRPLLFGHSIAPHHRCPFAQFRRSPRTRPSLWCTNGTDSTRTEHCQPEGTAWDQFHQASIRCHFPPRVSRSRRLSVERPPLGADPQPCRA